MKKLIIAAGTGFLGNALINHFKDSVTDIVVLTRGKAATKNNVRYVNWDAKTMTGWERELEGADVLINLAGKSVDCRYTEANKNEIMASRVDSTVILGKAIQQCTNPPKQWINSSTATIYRHSTDKQMDETVGEIGHDFSMNVAKMWERVFFEADTPQTVKTAMRTSIVLGKSGGAFVPLKKLAQFGLGGTQGSGNQFISWIHEADFARAVAHIISNEVEGVINVVSPQPSRNADFMKALRHAIRIPFGLNITTNMLKLGAKIIGTETELVLKSRNVIPKRLTDTGFTFKYGNLAQALENLV
jgi:uncharacterized protein (TIGR01777 family)